MSPILVAFKQSVQKKNEVIKKKPVTVTHIFYYNTENGIQIPHVQLIFQTISGPSLHFLILKNHMIFIRPLVVEKVSLFLKQFQ